MTSTIGTVANTLGYLSSSTGTTSVPNIASASAGTVQTAVSLSANAGVIASLGGVGASVSTYDAAGLLNAIAQAGAASSTPLPVPVSGTDTQTQTQQATDQGAVTTLPSDPSASGVYNSSGTVASSNLSSNWVTILKSNPTYASSVINYSMMQGIVGSLSVLA